jgi:lipid-A-disaccharide synthase
MKAMTIYFVAGEVSADNHGAALMRSLRELDPGLTFIGRGGSQMQEVAGKSAIGRIRGGGQFKNWLGDAAVLGLWEVLRKYGYFREQFRETLKEVLESKPDAVVLIDYPGFNLRLARALRRNISLQPVRPAGLKPAESDAAERISVGRTGHSPMFRPKIIYYISPQVWAWNRGRIKEMARCLDLVLCIFPFESDLYNKSGLRAVFVGHPMIERLQGRKIDAERDPNLIGLFPGSRLREVRKIFPVMIEAARLLLKTTPRLRFEVAAASEDLARELTTMLPSHLVKVIRITIGETAEIMQRAWAGMVASGSATLEAAYFRLPFVLIYKVAWPTYLAGRAVVKVKYLGMPNLLADKEVVPEFIQHRAEPHRVADEMRILVDDSIAREQMISEFDMVIARLGSGGASEKAAQTIIGELQEARCPDRPGRLLPSQGYGEPRETAAP